MENGWSAQPMRAEHISDVVALQRLCYPPPFPTVLLWAPDHLRNHLLFYPEGQFVVLEGDRVVGSASNMLTYQEIWVDYIDWEDVTGGLDLANHKPDGNILYGADISVHPQYRGRGVARALYQARFDLVRREELAGFCTACRVPDFAASGVESVFNYAKAVAENRLTDRTLTPLLRLGMEFTGVQENIMDDPESGHAAALLEWRP
jgi:GNAT superfamily N-acetyltransferase